MYQCNGCEYCTNRKSNIENHVFRKNLCFKFEDGKERYTHVKKNTKKCEYCEREFLSSSSKCKHEKKCKINQESINHTNITNNTNNINIVNNIIIKIDLAQYDDPYIPRTLEFEIKKYLKSLIGTRMEEMTTLCYPEIFSLIYFNKDVPENHTILYKNKKENVIEVYKGDSFIPIHKEEFKDSLERILEYCINDCTNGLGNEVYHFYNKHHRHREDGKNEKNKEFELYLKRANGSKKMVEEQIKLLNY